MATLIEATQRIVELRKEWLAESEEALKLVNLLPQELLQLKASSADVTNKKLFIRLDNQPGIIDTLKDIKVFDLTYKANSLGSWTLEGEMDLPDGTEVSISVSNMETPEHCRIEKYEEMQMVTKYKAICNEDEKEITQTTRV